MNKKNKEKHRNEGQVVGLLSLFMHAPWEIHSHTTLLLVHLKHDPKHGLLYYCHYHLHVKTFLDCKGTTDRCDWKSTFNLYTYVGGNLVTWWSNK